MDPRAGSELMPPYGEPGNGVGPTTRDGTSPRGPVRTIRATRAPVRTIRAARAPVLAACGDASGTSRPEEG
ncbi:hypothetical protein GCM10022252_70790 [Streptosporangium oxazolinicum]|uniref:Uncharacterized protein n=1 Tax=Streptosporangium oxazolinicum TaxID=909287 RepID=A0ABP8BHW6_9ACTN